MELLHSSNVIWLILDTKERFEQKEFLKLSFTDLKCSDVSPDDVRSVVAVRVQLARHTEEDSPALGIRLGQHENVTTLYQLWHKGILQW